MFVNRGIISTLNSVSLLPPMSSTDDSISYTEGVGTANTTSLSLSSIIYVPKLSLNLSSLADLSDL